MARRWKNRNWIDSYGYKKWKDVFLYNKRKSTEIGVVDLHVDLRASRDAREVQKERTGQIDVMLNVN